MTERSLSDAIMPFGDHLEELRRRLIYAILGIVPILALALLVGRPVLSFLIEPVQEALLEANLPAKLQQTGVAELFYSYVKVSFILTIMVGAPWVFWQLWMFIAPGLYANERRFAYLLSPLSIVLTAVGIAFMYLAMLPVVLAFFIHFSTSLIGEGARAPSGPLPAGVVLPEIPVLEVDPEAPTVGQVWVNGPLKELRVCIAAPPPPPPPAAAAGGGEDGPAPEAVGPPPLVLTIPMMGMGPVMQQFRVSEYVGMLLGFALAFAVAFQMPVVVLLLGWAGIIQPVVLAKYRKHAMMICAVLGAVLTPADPISMLLLAVPLYGLYELGLVMLRVLPASRVSAGFDAFSRRKAAARRGEAPIDADGGAGGGP
jgi:sec-independent protein translocase protein TatC